MAKKKYWSGVRLSGGPGIAELLRSAETAFDAEPSVIKFTYGSTGGYQAIITGFEYAMASNGLQCSLKGRVLPAGTKLEVKHPRQPILDYPKQFAATYTPKSGCGSIRIFD